MKYSGHNFCNGIVQWNERNKRTVVAICLFNGEVRMRNSRMRDE